tara:strand:- start:79 stop:978 length:900 start_codon:yes stop_codon:yes gene_type:complete
MKKNTNQYQSRENKHEKEKENMLFERFQQLAGIKPLYEQNEGGCKKVQMCPACPSNNNYNPNRSYELGGNIASECGSWSTNNCMTIDGNTPNPGDFFLVGSAQQVWMVYNVMDPTSNEVTNRQGSGCPELGSDDPVDPSTPDPEPSGSVPPTEPSGSVPPTEPTGSVPPTEPTGSIGGMPFAGIGAMGKPTGGRNKFPLKRRVRKKTKIKMPTKGLKELKNIIKKELKNIKEQARPKPTYCNQGPAGLMSAKMRVTYCEKCKTSENRNFMFPVPTEVHPSGRLGGEYCRCCKAEVMKRR